MLNKKQADKTASVLINAYFKDTLQNNRACACAVGNLVADANNYSFKLDSITDRPVWAEEVPYWHKAFVTDSAGHQHKWPFVYNQNKVVKKEIDSTGIDLEDLMKIENLFETGEDEFEGMSQIFDWMSDAYKTGEMPINLENEFATIEA